MQSPGLSISEIVETLTFQSGFNTNVVILGTTLLGFASGIIGVFALLRKRALMTDALSHATLPGIAIAFLAAQSLGFQRRSIPILLIGATISGVIGIVCIQFILRHTRLREDTAIGIILSVFFGAGIVGLSYVQSNAPNNSAGLNAFIYGQAATMSSSDVILMGSIAVIAVLATLLLLKEFTLVCFNDSFAKVDGWPVSIVDLLMMALVVIVTVAGLQAVGLILVVAMLIIPPVSARFWTDRVWKLVLIAGLIGALSAYTGSVISALLPRKPAGAVIVLTSGVFFALSMFLAPSRGVIAASIRLLRIRLRIAGDHVLELSHDLNVSTIPNQAFDELSRIRGWSLPLRWLLLRALKHDDSVVRLSNDGLVLSAKGVARGHRVARNHMLWEQYLVSYADIAPSHVDWSVDQVEHVLSARLVARLEQELAKQGIDIPPATPMKPGGAG